MNVLSLFDGMSCGRIALEIAGIKVDSYFASEIDKYAISVSSRNYDDIVQIGDVRQVDCKNLPDIDILIGGSPCQGFSFAGKQLNFDDPRSALFFEFVRVLKECKPRYFLLENVNMKEAYRDIITSCLGVDPVNINSNIISEANRNRWYWCNFNLDEIHPTYKDADEFAPGFLSMTIGTSSNRIFKRMNNFGALTATMYKGVRAAGRPILARDYCEGKHIDQLEKNKDYRMLTPEECERLQGVPVGYSANVSNTQRYKMLGNGWHVPTVAHIFKNLTR